MEFTESYTSKRRDFSMDKHLLVELDLEESKDNI